MSDENERSPASAGSVADKTKAIEIASQCWCDPETSSIEMDVRLAAAFASRLAPLLDNIDSLRLTDAEREAVAWAEDCADSQREWKIGATLRGLLERLGVEQTDNRPEPQKTGPLFADNCDYRAIQQSENACDQQIATQEIETMTDETRDPAASLGSVDEPARQLPPTFEQELCALINKHGIERGSNTPDWVLARLLMRTLDSYECAVQWISPNVHAAISPDRYNDLDTVSR